jgi:hypothetical protein
VKPLLQWKISKCYTFLCIYVRGSARRASAYVFIRPCVSKCTGSGMCLRNIVVVIVLMTIFSVIIIISLVCRVFRTAYLKKNNGSEVYTVKAIL